MNIRVDMNTPIKDGTEVVFRSPVDCSQITGLIVYHKGDDGNTVSTEFALADAHGNNVGDIDHLFAENVVVKVILDVTTGMAFVQNADTNAYLEGRFNGLSDSIVCKSSGEIVSITDSAERPLQGLTLYGKTTQNGTPTPATPAALESAGDSGSLTVTVMGKNLINPAEYIKGTSSTLNGDVITTNFKGGWLCVNAVEGYIKTHPKGTYTATFFPVTAGAACAFYIYSAATKAELKLQYITAGATSLTFTVDEEFYLSLGGIEPFGEYAYRLQLEVGTASTAYEPYKAVQTLSIPTPNGLPGIPLGVTIPDIIKASDVLMAGVWWNEEKQKYDISDTIDFARRCVSTLRLIKRILTTATSVANATNGNKYATIPIAQTLDVYPLTNAPVMSNRYSWNDNLANNTCYIAGSTLIVCDNRFTDLATANAILAEEKPEFIYALRTPIETPLTDMPDYTQLHTNYPNTTVMADGAGVAVTYVADTKNYIDKKFNELASAIVNNT